MRCSARPVDFLGLDQKHISWNHANPRFTRAQRGPAAKALPIYMFTACFASVLDRTFDSRAKVVKRS